VLVIPGAVQAGMPSVTLNDTARLRLHTVSFFLAAFLLSSWAVKLLWNYLGKDFAWLPRLTYARALGVVTLWGLLFVLVLTMISGARELMTPGAWEKQGLTYRVAPDSPASPRDSPSSPEMVETRRAGLEALRSALWEYARGHEGRFPSERFTAGVPEGRWRVPGDSGMNYLFVSGLHPDQGAALLAYEPDIFGGPRLVLLTSGEIRWLGADDFSRAQAPGAP